tara:strand:- start:163 stop:387 length:225 start_codon:yes stop_codon:yes gene_type:complete
MQVLVVQDVETMDTTLKTCLVLLMTKPDQQQLGISNDIKERIRRHKSFGWSEMDCTGPHEGKEVLEIENNSKSG